MQSCSLQTRKKYFLLYIYRLFINLVSIRVVISMRTLIIAYSKSFVWIVTVMIMFFWACKLNKLRIIFDCVNKFFIIATNYAIQRTESWEIVLFNWRGCQFVSGKNFPYSLLGEGVWNNKAKKIICWIIFDQIFF